MKPIIEKSSRFLQAPVGLAPRGLLVVAALLLIAGYLLPLWDMTMFAPQYPHGLRLHIYSHGLEGGSAGQDLTEVNLLNHYIGMKDLAPEDFGEFRWMPFLLGALGMLFLRAAVFGTIGHMVDVTVLFAYFASFSLWSFAHTLYLYGHELAPSAPVKVPPFMPPLFGRAQLANFEVYSYPGLGAYALACGGALLVTALVVAARAWTQGRSDN